jgi:hypothetical protein
VVTDWRQRERLFYWRSPLAIVPAQGFLPAFVWLIFSPRVAHATAWAAVGFPLMAVAEFVGVAKLVQGCLERPFNLPTMLSLGAMLDEIVPGCSGAADVVRPAQKNRPAK